MKLSACAGFAVSCFELPDVLRETASPRLPVEAPTKWLITDATLSEKPHQERDTNPSSGRLAEGMDVLWLW